MKTNLDNIEDSGFKVPNTYFQELEDRMVSTIKLKDQVSATGFDMPERYFDTLEDTIMNQVKPEPKVISMFNKSHLIYVSSIAAAVVILISVFNRPVENIHFDNIETASIEHYLYEEGLGTNELASLLTDDDVSNFATIEIDLDDDAVETYLLNNSVIEEIIEQ